MSKHRYLQKSRLLKFCYVPASIASSTGIFVTTTNSTNHRYLKKSRLLKFCYVRATSVASSKGIFVATTNSTNQTNKVGSTCY